jgi:hypothetical protein
MAVEDRIRLLREGGWLVYGLFSSQDVEACQESQLGFYLSWKLRVSPALHFMAKGRSILKQWI